VILVDLNATIIGGVMVQLKTAKTDVVDESLIRHMVLNIIRAHVYNYKKDYGDIVLCSDSRRYWRKDIFPHYKANRKTMRDTSGLDWNEIHSIINKMKVELRENFPYKFIQVEGAEADDIIGVLAPRIAAHEKVLIISADHDFLQLQAYPNIEQYSPTVKKKLTVEYPTLALREKIIRGDSGDGIPNILSPGDVFVMGGRQVTLSQKRFDYLMEEKPDAYDTEQAKIGYTRNQMLIDLTFTPEELKQEIINTYDTTVPAPRRKIIDYLIEHRLKNLMTAIDEF